MGSERRRGWRAVKKIITGAIGEVIRVIREFIG